MHHEQGAGFAAEGFARSSGRPAVAMATSGRPGPVLLDIPMDVQRARISPAQPSVRCADEPAMPVTAPSDRAAFLDALPRALDGAERLLILAGGEIRTAGARAVEAFRHVVEQSRIPVVTSLMGVDAIPATSPLHVGLMGSYGNRWATWAVGRADVLLVLGSGLDVHQTRSGVDGFREGRSIFHVDVDEAELNYHVPGCQVLHEDLASFLPFAASMLRPSPTRNDAWLRQIAQHRDECPDTTENVPANGINPNVAVRQISEVWADAFAYVADVGQHQMWAAQSIRAGPDRGFLTSGGMGSMGFGLPATIGAALEHHPAPVALIA